MQVILVHEDNDKREVLQFFFESQYTATVNAFKSVQDALNHLLDESAADLIVLQDNEKSLRLFKYIATTETKTPIILIENSESLSINAFPELTLGRAKATSLTKDLQHIVNGGIQQGTLSLSESPSDYCRIHTSMLLRVCPLKADIYVRLSAAKYIKIFNKGDPFDVVDLDRYLVQKKIEYLYIKRDEVTEFVNKFKNDLESFSEVAQTPIATQKMAVSVHEIVREMGSQLGFTPQVQEIAKSGIKLTLKTIGANPKLSKYLKLLSVEKEKYITSHSMAVAQIACSLAAAMDWASPATYQKLTFAAFFHDIEFKNQSLCQIKSLSELQEKASQFTAEEMKFFKNHPFSSSEIVKKFSEIPADVDIIIQQHHERPDGSGFPKRIQANYIAPLSCIFIVAHDIVDFLHHEKTGPESAQKSSDLQSFLLQYRLQNSHGTFKKILASIEKNKAAFGT